MFPRVVKVSHPKGDPANESDLIEDARYFRAEVCTSGLITRRSVYFITDGILGTERTNKASEVPARARLNRMALSSQVYLPSYARLELVPNSVKVARPIDKSPRSPPRLSLDIVKVGECNKFDMPISDTGRFAFSVVGNRRRPKTTTFSLAPVEIDGSETRELIGR